MSSVATIIVTYNGSKWIEKCLKNLLASTESTQIIIVDNNSSDNTIGLIKPYLNNIELIRLSANLGFGGANNIGIQWALSHGFSHFFLLNQDAYVQEDCISKLLYTALENPEYGIISPVQLNPTGIALDSVFSNQVKKYFNPDNTTLLGELAKRNPAKPVNIRFVGAAAWFLSAELIRKVGFFHPVFFHYGEDNNYAARAQYFGFNIGVQVTTAMIHDRAPRDKVEFLPVKLRSFPLHQLLDIRKPFIIGWMVGLYQLLRTWSKLKKISGDRYKELFLENRQWFFNKSREALRIRKKGKSGFKMA